MPDWLTKDHIHESKSLLDARKKEAETFADKVDKRQLKIEKAKARTKGIETKDTNRFKKVIDQKKLQNYHKVLHQMQINKTDSAIVQKLKMEAALIREYVYNSKGPQRSEDIDHYTAIQGYIAVLVKQ